MLLKRTILMFSLLRAPSFADVASVIEKHIMPRHAAFSKSTQALAKDAHETCDPALLKPAFHAAYDAWISVSHIQFGPIEDQGSALVFMYWPDPKDSTGKALNRLISATDPIVDDASSFAEVSVAAQGFTALERLLFDLQSDTAYACRLTRAIARGLAENSDKLSAAWPEFANIMTTGGADGNTRFQSPAEAQRVLYTALTTGLEFLHDQRLGRPLGTFDRQRPRRAEARRSERTAHHIALSLAALEELTVLMHDGPLTQTRAAFADAKSRVAKLDDPMLAGVSEPTKRIRIEALQRKVQDIRNAVNTEIGKPLGIMAGFNSLDGD